ncbi:MAG: hypothetical protein IIU56_06395, partial [Peptococcaceae bacterium]|nr:hypothetical protein [Peptococcaceae bacterium]
VRNADCIMVLEQGRIIERGTHDQLIEQRADIISSIQEKPQKAHKIPYKEQDFHRAVSCNDSLHGFLMLFKNFIYL